MMRLSGRLAAIAAALVGLMGCDPCSGIAQCASSGYLGIDGQIVNAPDGRGLDGVRIDVVRSDGALVERDSISTTTANGGHWRVEFIPTSAGSIDVRIRVTSPDGFSYQVRGVQAEQHTRTGDANVLERWVGVPYFSAAGELYVRGTADERVVGATTEFRRTGGVEIVGPGVVDGVVRATSDFGGRFPLFPLQAGGVFGVGLGDVVGDLTIRRSPSDITVARDIRVAASYLYRAPTSIIRVAVGP